MADPAEFTPGELDRMEDALESLELAAALDEPSIAVRRRLHDYRQILALSRTALPMVEVPRGLLDGVLAEARAAAEVPVVTPLAAASARPGLWSRLRRALLLPGVALATTAALVLLFVEREDAEAPVSAGAEQRVAKNDASVDATENGRAGVAPKAEASASSRAEVAAEVRAAESPPPPAGVVAPPASAAPAPAIVPLSETPTDDLAPAEENDGDVEQLQKNADAKPDPAKLGYDQETTPRWDIIARGDRARHKSDCAAARSEYTLALGDLDARVRARAHAGLGLCEAADGDRPAADAAYRQARELDAEIVGFIEAERPRGARGGTTSSRAAKAKKAGAPVVDDAFESDEAKHE